MIYQTNSWLRNSKGNLFSPGTYLSFSEDSLKMYPRDIFSKVKSNEAGINVYEFESGQIVNSNFADEPETQVEDDKKSNKRGKKK